MKHSLRSGCLQTRGLRVFGVTFLFVSLSAFCARAQSGSYHFVKIVDNLTVRPDTGATFQFNNGLQSEARLDAGTVVFRTAENDSIWVANSDGTGLRKLVDLTTPAPGGTSVFRELGIGDGADEPLIKDGTVVFPGTINTSSANVYITGLYSIPVAGGAVTRIADSQTVVPDGDGTAFENFGSNTALAGNFSVSAGKIAFNALTDKGDGVYLASVHGSGLTALADGYHPGSSGIYVSGQPIPLSCDFKWNDRFLRRDDPGREQRLQRAVHDDRRLRREGGRHQQSGLAGRRDRESPHAL